MASVLASIGIDMDIYMTDPVMDMDMVMDTDTDMRTNEGPFFSLDV